MDSVGLCQSELFDELGIRLQRRIRGVAARDRRATEPQGDVESPCDQPPTSDASVSAPHAAQKFQPGSISDPHDLQGTRLWSVPQKGQ